MAEYTKEQETMLRNLAVAYANRVDGGGRTGIEISHVLEQAGLDFTPPPPPEGLSPEQQEQYQASMQSLQGLQFVSGLRKGADVYDAITDALEYQRMAADRIAKDYQTLNDPNATSAQRSQAQQSIDQLSVSNVGDIKDPNSPLSGFRKDGPGYFGSSKHLAEVSDRDKSTAFLEQDVELNADDYVIGDQVRGVIDEYAGKRENISYNDIPERDATRVESVDARQIGDDEMISQRAVDMNRSAYEDPNYAASIDRQGLDAMGRGIDYFGNLAANGGRDAVAKARLHRGLQDAERIRAANVAGALRQLDLQGMGGSGAELDAQLTGARDSMRAMFDAQMQAEAMRQERQDNAAERQAILGEAHRKVAFGEADTIAQALDQATRERAATQVKIEQENTDTLTTSREADQRYREGESLKNADLADTAAADNQRYTAEEMGSRNRFLEGGLESDKQTELGALSSDAGVRAAIDTGNIDRTRQQTLDYVTQGNTARTLGQQDRALDLQEQAQPSELDYVLEALKIPVGIATSVAKGG